MIKNHLSTRIGDITRTSIKSVKYWRKTGFKNKHLYTENCDNITDFTNYPRNRFKLI